MSHKNSSSEALLQGYTTSALNNFNSTDHGANVTTNQAPLDIYREYRLRFGPYTAVSVAGLLFNVLSLMAMTHIRGRRTVHHLLLVNLAICDMCGSVLLWFYYNSPYLVTSFSFDGYRRCLFILTLLLGKDKLLNRKHFQWKRL